MERFTVRRTTSADPETGDARLHNARGPFRCEDGGGAFITRCHDAARCIPQPSWPIRAYSPADALTDEGHEGMSMRALAILMFLSLPALAAEAPAKPVTLKSSLLEQLHTSHDQHRLVRPGEASDRGGHRGPGDLETSGG
jgi:hypothetical protein